MTQTRTSMTLYVESDHVLPDGDMETVEREIEVTITRTWYPAERDVGYDKPWFDDVAAVDMDGHAVHLSDLETERAEELLCRAHYEDRIEAAEMRAEMRREDRHG